MTIDIDALLLPLDGDGAADIRFTAGYKAIIEARREDNPSLAQGIWTRDVKRADWVAVENLCTEILAGQAKDLQVACWLAEALLHRGGFAGLPPGLRLLSRLCRQFWPTLQPRIEDGDLEPRKAAFEWLNARFPTVLRNLPVVHCADSPEIGYTWTDLVNAQLLEGLRQRDPKSVERSIAGGAVSLAAFTAARERTETAFWVATSAALQASIEALAELNSTLGELCGNDAPGLGAIAVALRDLLGLALVALSARQKRPPPPPERNEAPPVAAVAALAPSGVITDRADAYSRLADIAAQLQRLEPHSPVPYLIRQAVAWGDKSFAELMLAFAAADLDVPAVLKLLGLASLGERGDADDR